MRNIALCGKARAGKDTVAAYLVKNYGYKRLAFADPLKEMALAQNPIITYVAGEPLRLAYVVALYGWDNAKDMFPEVRRTLQHIGQGIRQRDRSFWVRLLMREAAHVDGPVVVTDVRYENEYRALLGARYDTVRVVRPGAGLIGSAGQHDSETELDSYCMRTLLNDGSLDLLHARLDELVSRLNR